MKPQSNCESCLNYEYDEEYEYFTCIMNLDEDEMRHFITCDFRQCPYFQYDNDYKIVYKQIENK